MISPKWMLTSSAYDDGWAEKLIQEIHDEVDDMRRSKGLHPWNWPKIKTQKTKERKQTMTHEKISCDVCGKEVGGAVGLATHKRRAHATPSKSPKKKYKYKLPKQVRVKEDLPADLLTIRRSSDLLVDLRKDHALLTQRIADDQLELRNINVQIAEAGRQLTNATRQLLEGGSASPKLLPDLNRDEEGDTKDDYSSSRDEEGRAS